MLNSLYRQAITTVDLKVTANAYIENIHSNNMSINSLITSQNLIVEGNSILNVDLIRANTSLEVNGVNELLMTADSVTLSSSDKSTGSGGDITIDAGNGQTKGGNVVISCGTCGDTPTAKPGSITIETPDFVGTINSSIYQGGNITLHTGMGKPKAQSGSVILFGGEANPLYGTPGHIYLQAGNTTVEHITETPYYYAGDVYIAGGTTRSNAMSGGIHIFSGEAYANGDNKTETSTVWVHSGRVQNSSNVSSRSGNVELYTESVSNLGRTGTVKIYTTGVSGIGSKIGDILIYTGTGNGLSDANGGNVSITTGNGHTTGNGGLLSLIAGNGGATGNGGNLTIKTGVGNGGGTPGSLKFAVGDSYYKWPSTAPVAPAPRTLTWTGGAGTVNSPYTLAWT